MTTTAARTPAKSGPTWNPFRCSGTALPPNVLLAVKLMAVVYLVRILTSDGTYSELPVAPESQTATLVLVGLRLLAMGLAPLAALLLLFNHGLRVLVFIFGLSVALEFAVRLVGHADLFLGLFVILAAFEKDNGEPLRVRYLVILTYLAGGLAWVAAHLQPHTGRLLSLLALPPVVIPVPEHWSMVLVCFVLAAALSVRRVRPLAIWAGIVLHCMFRDITGPFAGAYTILAAYLVFADWPHDRLTVLYDGDCGFCNKTREWISRFDLERLYNWKPYQSGAGAAFGISEEALAQRAYVVSPRGIQSGFQAFRTMALYNPLTYFGLAAIVIAVHNFPPALQNAVLAALILGFSPLVRPIGEVVYNWVARNRHRLPPRDCKIPE